MLHHNFIGNAVIVLSGFSVQRPPDQPVSPQQLLLQATLRLQQGRTLQESLRLVPPKSFSCDSIYNLPSTFRKSGTNMGYGKKSDFTKDLTSSPGSSKYFIKTIFDKNKTSQKGFSLYESRSVDPPLLRNYPTEAMSLSTPSRCLDQTPTTISRPTRVSPSACARNYPSSTEPCPSRSRTAIQDQGATRIPRACRQGEDTASQSTREREPLCSTRRGLRGSSSSVRPLLCREQQSWARHV